MIDAHFHIWQLERADYGWLTPATGAIYRDVSLDDWRAVSAPCGIQGGILVQAAPTDAETQFLLHQAHHAPDVLAVVGWVDLLAADASARIAELARHPKLKALRPMLQDIADPHWILQRALQPAFAAMLQHDLAFDALVRTVHLPAIDALARRWPTLRIVIDHGAKPDIAGAQWQDWAKGMAQLAHAPQVVCKLSGLWGEAGPQAPVQTLEPYARQILSCFGPARVMWGSDWPVLDMAGDYAAWHVAATGWIDPSAHADVFGQVAKKVYRV